MKTIISIIICLFIINSISAQTTKAEAEKIATFCKVWGFLKYYHPVVAKGKIDWDKEFMTRVKVVSQLNSKEEISNYYIEWIYSLGKVKHCRKCDNNVPDSLKFNLNLDWLKDSTVFTGTVIKQLEYIRDNRNQKKNYYEPQYNKGGILCYETKKPYNDSDFPSYELRLLCLARYWNIVNYFFPYKYIIGEDWEQVLVDMIPKFKEAKSPVNYHLSISELVARINDSHAGFYSKYTEQYFGSKYAPFSIKIIDNKAIVTGFHSKILSKKDDIQYGDVFITVNNISIAQIVKEKSKYIGASNEVRKLWYFQYALLSGNSDSVYVTFERNGKVSGKTIHRYYFSEYNDTSDIRRLNVVCKILEGNIGYINMGLLQYEHVKDTLEKLKNTKAIIFDLRNYPNETMRNIANFLNNEERPIAKFTEPNFKYPGVFNYIKPSTCGHKNDSFYKGKVVILFNEETQSQAEFTCMGLQTAPNVISIGSQTAGADGNVASITLPGGYKTYMSGYGVYYPDGRETQRIGIVPDIEVKPTIEGIKAGRDEVLEKAIEVINKK